MSGAERNERKRSRAGGGGERPTAGGSGPPEEDRSHGGRRSRLPEERPLSALEGLRIAVVGLGASGRAAARLALERGGEVYATDHQENPEIAAAGDELRSLGARVELGGHRLAGIAGADAVVVSPGIPPEAPVLRGLRERGVPWISELEFAFRFLSGPLIAVTGTNGKTTTAALAAHLLREAGYRVGLGGNVGAGLGPAASDLARLDPAPERIVLEVSSFQLADIERFRPDVGVVTNLAPDHLDRYESVEAYYADKARLFDNADEACRWVLNGDDGEVAALPGDAPGTRFFFRLSGEREADARLADGVLRLRTEPGGTERPILRRDEFPLMGRHNVANALAAVLAAHLSDAAPDALGDGLRSFEPLPHRLEPVAEIDGVLWVNDSKGTNVSATLGAVRSLERPVVLLLGGTDKGEDFGRLRSLADASVRAVVAYGEARGRIGAALEGALPLARVEGSFEEAVRTAVDRALPGDVLLLSPACSSFDMFENYEHRGRRFRELAREAA